MNRFFIIALLFIAGPFSVTTLAVGCFQDEDPFVTQPKESEESEWGKNKAGEGGEASKWSSGAATIDKRAVITSGKIGCPVIMGGSGIFSTETRKQIGNLDLEIRSSTLTALSNDGSHFAVASKTHNQDGTSVSVYDLQSQKKTCEIPGAEDEILDVLLITRSKYVVTAGRKSPVVRVWDAKTGKSVKEFEMPKGTRLDQGNVAFTNDGKYMAVVRRKELVVIKVASGKVVATMEPPSLVDRDGNKSERSRGNDHSSIYAWIQDLEFSPDGTELAAVSTHRGNRLLCWNKDAELVVNKPFSLIQKNAFWENDIQWLPDGQAWLVGGNLVERSSGRILLAFAEKFATDVHMLIHDQNTILGRLGSEPNKISKVEIPWGDIKEAQQAIEDKVPALIAPNQAVDIRIEFGKTLGTAGEAKKLIIEAVQKRLKRDGINFKPGSPNYFQLRFSESKGDTLPIYQRQSRFDFRGHDTGREISESKGSLVVEFYGSDSDKPAWREVLDATNSRSFSEEINSKSVRASMLKRLSTELGRMHIPYFMPKDDSLLALPMVFK